MRKILLRDRNGKEWHEVTEAAFKSESHLHDLLYQDPRLIPFADLGEGHPEPRVFVREAGLPGSGSTDLIGVDEQGGITIIECKLATNPEQKRKVIGQVLEYAAFLWQMIYERFEKLFEREFRKVGKTSLPELVAPPEDAEWAEDQFQRSVQAVLESGDFTLIVAVDSLTDELRRIIEYLNRRSGGGQTICAVEVGYYVSEQHEVIAPRLVGSPPEGKGAGGTGARWDEASYFAAAAERCSAQTVSSMQRLYEFARRESDNCKWGRGKDGSFTFRLERNGVSGSIFSCYTSGVLQLNFHYMYGRVDEAAIQRFAAEVSRLPGFADLHQRLQKVQLAIYSLEDVLREPEALDAFEAAVLRVRDSLGG